jgi:hypothetical protein
MPTCPSEGRGAPPCGDLADAMMQEFKRRIAEKIRW